MGGIHVIRAYLKEHNLYIEDGHFKEWTSKNIFFVKDLLKENGDFFNVQEFNGKFDIRVVFFLEYLGCINDIRAYLREHNLYTLRLDILKNTLKYMISF